MKPLGDHSTDWWEELYRLMRRNQQIGEKKSTDWWEECNRIMQITQQIDAKNFTDWWEEPGRFVRKTQHINEKNSTDWCKELYRLMRWIWPIYEENSRVEEKKKLSNAFLLNTAPCVSNHSIDRKIHFLYYFIIVWSFH